MCWPDPGEEPAVKTTILDDDTAAKRAAKHWTREQEVKVGAGDLDVVDGWITLRRWTSGAAAVCKQTAGWHSEVT